MYEEYAIMLCNLVLDLGSLGFAFKSGVLVLSGAIVHILESH